MRPQREVAGKKRDRERTWASAFIGVESGNQGF